MKVKVAQSCLTLCDPLDYTVHGILQARVLEYIAVPFSMGSSQPRSPALQVDSFPAESPGKPKNTGVGSLSLLQWIFPTQELNQGLLHCRQILYQLSHQGSLKSAELVPQLKFQAQQAALDSERVDVPIQRLSGRRLLSSCRRVRCCSTQVFLQVTG